MKRLWSKISALLWLLIIVGVYLLFAGQVLGFGLIGLALIYFTLDRFSLLFFRRTESEMRIKQQLCPACGHDLSRIGTGQTTCPNCGEPVPAPLRKWGS